MLEELERRNYSPGTARCYLYAVQRFAEHFHRAPDQRLGADTRVSALPVAGTEAVSENGGAANSRAAVLLHQDTQAAIHV